MIRCIAAPCDRVHIYDISQPALHIVLCVGDVELYAFGTRVSCCRIKQEYEELLGNPLPTNGQVCVNGTFVCESRIFPYATPKRDHTCTHNAGTHTYDETSVATISTYKDHPKLSAAVKHDRFFGLQHVWL